MKFKLTTDYKTHDGKKYFHVGEGSDELYDFIREHDYCDYLYADDELFWGGNCPTLDYYLLESIYREHLEFDAPTAYSLIEEHRKDSEHKEKQLKKDFEDAVNAEYEQVQKNIENGWYDMPDDYELKLIYKDNEFHMLNSSLVCRDEANRNGYCICVSDQYSSQLSKFKRSSPKTKKKLRMTMEELNNKVSELSGEQTEIEIVEK